jgi:hypothetical protein
MFAFASASPANEDMLVKMAKLRNTTEEMAMAAAADNTTTPATTTEKRTFQRQI